MRQVGLTEDPSEVLAMVSKAISTINSALKEVNGDGFVNDLFSVDLADDFNKRMDLYRGRWAKIRPILQPIGGYLADAQADPI
ncbi:MULTISPECIES: hypothetical protein [unclassified Caulobacter]|uniref:hypothetical protein n=1 Tax=unclassified Caulobacter TaxID=2648921 RepID=UPI001E5EF045|nr:MULTISPECIES: hypothetical protein [unclassified Caulobacter]